VAKYGNFLYGTAKYGETPRLNFSVEPMDVVVLDFARTFVSWQSPTGNFSRIRLVRNQIGFPETAEDGIIIWEEAATQGSVSRNSFTDGEDNPTSTGIVSGRPIYYSMFLFTDSNVWVRAGDVFDIVPSNHDTHKKVMDIIPRVFTSEVQSQLGVVDETTALYKFLEGVSFTLEQEKTAIDLLRPKHTADITSHLLLPVEFFSLGLIPEPNIPIKNQKILAREARYLYSHKGLKTGLETYTESLTGYAPVITVSPNKLLTVQDSTFYNSIGNWLTNTCTLTASKEQVPSTTDYVIDNEYTGKVVASGAAYVTLGADDPIKKGIPVIEDTDYTFSYKVKSPSSAGNTQLTVVWYDRFGVTLGSDYVASSISANNTWKTGWYNTTAPVDAYYASLKISFSASGTYYIDQVYTENAENTDNTTYQEARAVTVFLEANKTNYVKNPSFENNVTDSWTSTGSPTITQDSSIPDEVYSGTNSAKIVATGNWTYSSNTAPVETGVYYTASGYVKASSNLTLTLVGRDSLGTITDNTHVYPLGTFADWVRFQAVLLVDANATDIATYEIKFSGGSGTFYLDSIQFEKGVAATEYFDGTLPSEFGAVWEGTAHNSYTRLYVNKPFKVPRLANTLNDWMPPNTFWRLVTYGGVEYTNLTV
jgi:Carbohydrate binding domain